MSCDQNYPLPQVFIVDGGGGQQHADQPPSLVPCWSFPPPQERVRSRGKSPGCMGVSYCSALTVLMLFLLVFTALGFEAYQIHNMQEELKDLRNQGGQFEPVTEFNAPQKQIGFGPELKKEDDRPAAHVIGRIEIHPRKTLRWDPRVGRAFVSGAVAYRYEDGALQVNETGLYHVYSRVELIFRACTPASSFIHTVFVRTSGRSTPMTLMEAHREGFCSLQQKHAWTTESYLGSALHLEKSDKVYVNVSHPDYLTHAHYANFFGLYKI
ncbi:tumor necrosis factor ligand superfamily member 6 [Centropristis striata]|uniref:tumor necrosis factor ligand superfamily member 6 n=1 Tax=Centropristis striata TaxID=184440 RepID=UPI0027E16B9E|nr:tumor necrosis factor ligand superfamily member 6 [Centropristis striata]